MLGDPPATGDGVTSLSGRSVHFSLTCETINLERRVPAGTPNSFDSKQLH